MPLKFNLQSGCLDLDRSSFVIVKNHDLLFFSCLGQALASGFESCCIDTEPEPNKLKQYYLQTTRLLHLAAKISPGLISNLQMCLVNLVSQLLQQLQDSGEENFESVIAQLYPLPSCEAKTLCLAKIQILSETV